MPITLLTRCPESFDAMPGDERRRHCAKCAVTVHDLSGLTEDEAHEVLGSVEGTVCARIARDASGNALFRAASLVVAVSAAACSAPEKPPANATWETTVVVPPRPDGGDAPLSICEIDPSACPSTTDLSVAAKRKVKGEVYAVGQVCRGCRK